MGLLPTPACRELKTIGTEAIGDQQDVGGIRVTDENTVHTGEGIFRIFSTPWNNANSQRSQKGFQNLVVIGKGNNRVSTSCKSQYGDRPVWSEINQVVHFLNPP